jgi:non-ribosomal peptide synthase protein (TIGR01720 family)
MEILFNYLGHMQQLENDDSLFTQWGHVEDSQNGRSIADVGPNATRFALFEISAAVVEETIQFSFLYNRQQRHQPGIRRWIKECQSTLQEIAQKLSDLQSRTTFTLSDFPLLPISYDGLEKLFTKSLPQVGVAPEDVEDIYPCAPLQEGLLLSQIKDPNLYHFHAIFEVNTADDGIPVDGERLLEAFQKVVDRHGALRTVFADSVYRGDIFNQIVVKKTDTGAVFLECDDSEVFEKLDSISILDLNYKRLPRLPHQITVCETSSGKVYFKAEINHGVIDGGSANIMLRDLAEAYHGRLPDEPGPSYSDYVAYIKRRAGGAGAHFWKTYLEGARPCRFPVLNTDATKEKGLASVPMTFDRFPELQRVCRKMKVTLANVMQAAWALCLRSYTKSEDVNFGVLTSGRDVPVNGIENSVGAFINMLVCRVKFDKHLTLKEMFQKVQDDYLQCLEHQHTSLAQVQHDLLSGDSLFNTAVSIQSDNATDGADRSSISFVPVQAHDPSEVRIDSTFLCLPMLIMFQVRCHTQC